MTDECQSVIVAGRNRGRRLHPRVVVCANSLQHCRGGTGGIVAKRCCRPVIGHRVGTGHLVPERDLRAA